MTDCPILVYRTGRETKAMADLRASAKEGGLMPPSYQGINMSQYVKREVGLRAYNIICMIDAGLMETRRTGPRKGKRHHATEKGLIVLKLAEDKATFHTKCRFFFDLEFRNARELFTEPAPASSSRG